MWLGNSGTECASRMESRDGKIYDVISKSTSLGGLGSHGAKLLGLNIFTLESNMACLKISKCWMSLTLKNSISRG